MKLCVEHLHETSVSICELVKVVMTVSMREVRETRRSERHTLLTGVKRKFAPFSTLLLGFG